MSLRSSVVIFQASMASTTSMASMTFTASLHQKKVTAPDDWMLPGNQTTNTDPFLCHGSSKTQIFTDIWTFSVRGCWGQSILLFWKLVDETQMVKPPEPTSHHNSRKCLILLSLRAIYFISLHYETPCSKKCESYFLINFNYFFVLYSLLFEHSLPFIIHLFKSPQSC